VPVPKTPVRENRDFQFRKYEIRLAVHFAAAPPAGYAHIAEYGYEFQFRGLIAGTFDFAHNIRAFFLAENICHFIAPRSLRTIPTNRQKDQRRF